MRYATVTRSEIARLVKDCEENGSARPYLTSDAPKGKDGLSGYPDPIPFESNGRDIFVVSDLHLANGAGADGRYDGCENFFFDAEFHRFLKYADQLKPGKKAILVINGDFIDFLRVSAVPGRRSKPRGMTRMRKQLKLGPGRRAFDGMSPRQQREFRRWQTILARIGMTRTAEELAASVSDKEEIYGLKTHRDRSVFRLDAARRGHREFFAALAEWIDGGHQLFIVKGNHDLEWYWLEVRNYLRLALAAGICVRQHRISSLNLQRVLQDVVLPAITFIDHSLLIDRTFYIEHGHRFDPLTRVIGNDTVNDGRELNIPLGSFINRYVLDYLEMKYPFLDNIRPTPNIVPLMLKQKFFTGLRLLLGHVSMLVKLVPRNYVHDVVGQRLLWQVLLEVFVLGAPPAASAALKAGSIQFYAWTAAWPLISYFATQLLGYVQIQEPDSLAANARDVFRAHPEYRTITFGHTHLADQFRDSDDGKNRWFYNTGTWIPVIETSAESVRENKTFNFIHVSSSADGAFNATAVQRWDDDALRPASMVLIR